MKDELWGIVNGTELAPGEDDADRLAKFVARKDRALPIIIVLSVQPSLLYLLEDADPVEAWRKNWQTNFRRKLGDVCGKISSLCGGLYFVTFIDDATRYVWI